LGAYRHTHPGGGRCAGGRAAFRLAGSVSGGVPRAESDLVLTGGVLGGDMALGRVLCLKPWIRAVFLALATIADITQNALFGGTGRGVPGRAGRCRPVGMPIQCSGYRCMAAITTLAA